MTSAITPQVTHPPLPVAEHILPRENGYGVHEVAAVTLGEFTGRVWRHVHRDRDGTRFEFGPRSTAWLTRQAADSARARSGCASWLLWPRRPQTSSGKPGRGSGTRQRVG